MADGVDALVIDGLEDPAGHVVEVESGVLDAAGIPATAVTLTLELEDVRGDTYPSQARLWFPPGADPDGGLSVWFACGYELPPPAVAEQLRRGRVVASSIDPAPGAVFPHPNPLGRGPNADIVLAHLVRGLPFVDPTRIVYGGGSAGGYATLLTAAEGFPVAAAVANCPVVNLAYQGAYCSRNFTRILADPPPDHPVLPVLLGMLLELDRACAAVYGEHGTGPGWLPHSPVAHLERITGPVATVSSTADFLVPFEQVGDRTVGAAPVAQPAGLDLAAAALADTPDVAVRLVDRLGDRAELHVVPPPAGAAPMERIDLTLSLPETPLPVPTPATPGRGWLVVVVDEGQTAIGLTHTRHAFQPDFDAFIGAHLAVPVDVDQLTPAKLDQLLDRYAGVEWLAPGFRRLDRPEAERRDVERGLTSYCAVSPAHRERFATLYDALAPARRVLPGPLVASLTGAARRPDPPAAMTGPSDDRARRVEAGGSRDREDLPPAAGRTRRVGHGGVPAETRRLEETPVTETSWHARWVEPAESMERRIVQRPVYHLVGTASLPPAREATLRITAHGIYEAFLNGERVGDRELTPGFTAYRKRLQVQTYDVTGLVRGGDNVLGVRLSDGWWRGQASIARRTNSFGDTVGVLAELTVVDGDGRRHRLTTDDSWVWSPSHILGADLVAGEIHDLRLVDPDWASPGTDRSGWAPVRVVDHDLSVLCETVGPPVRRIQELPAVSVTEVRSGRLIVDFGQVSNGWIRLADCGPEGTELTIVHGEVLTPEGDDVDIEAVGEPAFPKPDGVTVPFQTDVVRSAGAGSVFEPRHSTKGFRYVRIDGHPGGLDPSKITSVVVHSDVRPRGGFECSDDDLNRLHRAADWSLRTNLCDIPTDCPTRERAGWTGDWQIYVATAAYLYDVTDFSTKWLLDAAADQLDSGAITHFTPDPADHRDPRIAWWTDIQGSAGWGDAIVHVPWELYRATGDPAVLVPHVDAMRRWVDFAAGRAAAGRHHDRAAARPEPAPHERYLWDSGFHFGEWNEPGTVNPVHELGSLDHGPTATAFLHRSAWELARIGEVLGLDDVDSYDRLADEARRAWQLEFVAADGTVTPATQANLVRALAFGLVPDDHRDAVVRQLADLIEAAGRHLGTGFLATPFLLPVLADHGRLDLAYDLLLQRTPPSWLAMLDRGATTIWEAWDPFRPDGRVACSLNHFSMGAVVSFLHRDVAGLQLLEPGYRRFRVRPRPGGGLTWAATHHDSPHGRIAVRWDLDGRRGAIEVTVPAGTEAELVLPDGRTEVLVPGHHRRDWVHD